MRSGQLLKVAENCFLLYHVAPKKNVVEYGLIFLGSKDFIFLGSKTTADGNCSHENQRRLLLGRKAMINLDSIFKSRYITLTTKVCLVKAMVFPVVMWELDCKESWAMKNWCFWTVVLEKILESPLDSKEIKQVDLKGNQPWIFIGRTEAETKAEILWPPAVNGHLIGKETDAG